MRVRPAPALLLLTGLLLALVPGCTGDEEPTPKKDGSPPLSYFPTHEGGGGPDAAVEGTLVVRENCLLLVGGDGREYLVLWPDLLHLEVGGGRAQIVDEDGTVVATEGDRIGMGGGVTVPEVFVEQTGAPPPPCGDKLLYGAMPIKRLEAGS